MRDQGPEIEELCELLAGLELIQSIAETADRYDAMDVLEAIQGVAHDLIVILRSLDETSIFNLEKISNKNQDQSGA